jgi:hypothetical protein
MAEAYKTYCGGQDPCLEEREGASWSSGLGGPLRRATRTIAGLRAKRFMSFAHCAVVR